MKDLKIPNPNPYVELAELDILFDIVERCQAEAALPRERRQLRQDLGTVWFRLQMMKKRWIEAALTDFLWRYGEYPEESELEERASDLLMTLLTQRARGE